MKFKKQICLGLSSIMLLTTVTPVLAETISTTENNSITNGNLINVKYEQIDYASIVERLDLNELNLFIQEQKNNNQNISEEELEEKLKFKVLQEGIDNNIILMENDGSVTFNNDANTFSYAELPIIQNKLGPNEKKVFNKSLLKGLNVLTASQTAMNSYKSYYDSSSGYADDNADAFRHALWMCISAFLSGDSFAREFGIAHEDDYPSTALARGMDLFNNNVGISKSNQIFSNTPAEEVSFFASVIIDNAVKDGELRRFKGMDIPDKTYLVRTNSSGSRK